MSIFFTPFAYSVEDSDCYDSFSEPDSQEVFDFYYRTSLTKNLKSRRSAEDFEIIEALVNLKKYKFQLNKLMESKLDRLNLNHSSPYIIKTLNTLAKWKHEDKIKNDAVTLLLNQLLYPISYSSTINRVAEDIHNILIVQDFKIKRLVMKKMLELSDHSDPSVVIRAFQFIEQWEAMEKKPRGTVLYRR